MDKELSYILKLTQEELYEYVLQAVRSLASDRFDFEGVDSRKYLAIIPKDLAYFPVLASHLDFHYSFDAPPDDLKLSKGVLTGWRNGKRWILGGDDRNGVWTMLRLIRSGRCDLGYFFSTDEEEGRKGAVSLVESGLLKKIGHRISYFVQIDRQGTSELAYYPNGPHRTIDNQDFEALLNAFEYNGIAFSVVRGTKTDILNYCAATGLCGANISAGYYEEHDESESVDLAYLASLPDIVSALLERLGTAVYKIGVG